MWKDEFTFGKNTVYAWHNMAATLGVSKGLTSENNLPTHILLHLVKLTLTFSSNFLITV